MGRLQGAQNPEALQHPEDQHPQPPQHRPEAPFAHQNPPSNAPPADCPPQSSEKATQFSYHPPGAPAVAYPPQSPAQRQAVPFPPTAPPCSPSNVPPANYPPQTPERLNHFSSQPPGVAVAYQPQSPVPFPSNARPYDFHQAAAFKPQPVNCPPVDGPPYPQPQYRAANPQQQYPSATFSSGAPWTTGLFDCMDDPANALITAFLPCVTFGQVSEILDNGNPCLTGGLMYGVLAWLGVPCILSCTYRTKLRAKYNLLESPAPDLITHFLCEPCALCQEYRELKNRGLHPGIGWQANVVLQAQRQQVNMTPPVHQTMAAP
ncbi:protein PLANT CADMIUM RESISTANCE 4-like [Nymphaea colorata]|uniref:protein PLANT CADMIUM RESISTANCE 4-like n=1 Tax=Nymphaea colorata TaxID=210225 RepID=UPI00129D9211|nr:protein PLANT CADMIUM RESISTANCE 4-like [Nymphaea colorata]